MSANTVCTVKQSGKTDTNRDTVIHGQLFEKTKGIWKMFANKSMPSFRSSAARLSSYAVYSMTEKAHQHRQGSPALSQVHLQKKRDKPVSLQDTTFLQIKTDTAVTNRPQGYVSQLKLWELKLWGAEWSAEQEIQKEHAGTEILFSPINSNSEKCYHAWSSI